MALHQPTRRNTGQKTAGGTKEQTVVPGPPLPLRLVVTRVVNDVGGVLAEWRLFTNVPAEEADASTIGRRYAWRWNIETYHKLLKSSSMNAERWRQREGGAFLHRLCVASLACLTVWGLQRDESAAAAERRATLARPSGRQMKHRVESTAPALLAGLERLLALDDLMQVEDLAAILDMARRVLPRLFPQRPGWPTRKVVSIPMPLWGRVGVGGSDARRKHVVIVPRPVDRSLPGIRLARIVTLAPGDRSGCGSPGRADSRSPPREESPSMKRHAYMLGSLALVVAAALVTSSVADDATPSIKDVMVKLHKGATSPLAKLKKQAKADSVPWKEVQSETKDFVILGAALAKNEPPKGEMSSWKKLADSYFEDAKALDDAAKKEEKEALEKAVSKVGSSCQACHKAHRES